MSGYVRAVTRCDLSVCEHNWAYATEHAMAIDQHWHARLADNPNFFNGRLHLLFDSEFQDGGFHGRLLRTDFKSYLYWRDQGFADASVRDAFGSALLRSADGCVILGRQAPGHVNSGLTYLPGGFIDHRDVQNDGRIDVAGSVLREVHEELGLSPNHFSITPGAKLTFAGPLVSVAIELVSPLPADELLKVARAHISSQADAELEDVVAVASLRDLTDLSMPDYAQVLLASLLGEETHSVS